MDTYAYDASLPCKNPNCKSHGKPHPNCKCYSGGGNDHYAQGGSVCATGSKHMPGCEYFADGGQVKADPLITKGHAAAHHGLLGMLTKAGKANLAEPEKHTKILDEAKGHWSRMQDPIDSQMEVPQTRGVKLANHLSQGDHEKASDLMHEHPLVGSVGKTNLVGILSQLGDHIVTKEPHPEAMRGAVDYLHSAIKGHEKVKNSASSLFGKSKVEMEPSPIAREALKKHLDDLALNPEKLLDIGGSLGHYQPEQATQLAAMASTAVEYLEGIKPKPQQLASLDQVIPPDKASQAAYDRQLDIAEQPLLVMQHVKDGTLLPQDIDTVKTIYPGLYQSMVQNVGDALIDAKTKGVNIPYKQKQTLSMLLDTPLDSTMTPGAMQAIMQSQGAQQANQQAKGKKASGAELSQINKVDSMSQTPLEAREINRKRP